jgi:hypothetical protein
VGIGVTTFGFNAPLNRAVRKCASDPSAENDYWALQRRWTAAHAGRAASGCLAFLGFTIAAVV